MSDEIKRMDIREFKDAGFLQEVNRQFFHPHGLALEVVTDDETGECRLGGIWDYREDPEGLLFGDGVDREKAQRVADERMRHVPTRLALFGLAPDFPHILYGADVEPLGWTYPEEGK